MLQDLVPNSHEERSFTVLYFSWQVLQYTSLSFTWIMVPIWLQMVWFVLPPPTGVITAIDLHTSDASRQKKSLRGREENHKYELHFPENKSQTNTSECLSMPECSSLGRRIQSGFCQFSKASPKRPIRQRRLQLDHPVLEHLRTARGLGGIGGRCREGWGPV